MLKEFVSQNLEDLKLISTGMRILGMDAVLKSKSGHVGLPLGGAEMATMLYFATMNYASSDTKWIDRDRFILSAGHGSMLQYSALHLAGFDVSLDDIKNFRQFGSKTPGHPEYGHTSGIECTTGPLGQGISTAVGMALAERMLAARLNKPHFTPIEHNTYVIAGDGCLMEGVSSESCSLAGLLKLSRLIVLYDSNQITIDGKTDISFTENVEQRYKSYGWNVLNADAHDFIGLAKALDTAHEYASKPNGTSAPTLIICHSVAGKGSPKWEGKPKIHGNPMSADDVKDAKIHLGVTNTEPFYVPSEIYAAAGRLVKKRHEKHSKWEQTVKKEIQNWALNSQELLNWKLFTSNDFNPIGNDLYSEAHIQESRQKMASRVASGKALSLCALKDPRLVGGSADLAGSNNTTLSDSSFISAQDFSGRNIHFGVREHGMGAICNGITLHGGLRGYCATFAVFSDYMRPAVRLAALMNIPSIFIFTHDSFAVGEDGPTHQPIEHTAALRVIPNLNVYRPGDACETFASWECVLNTVDKPSCLLLTRQDLNNLDSFLPGQQRSYAHVKTGVKQGAYILKDFNAQKQRRMIFVATGSETEIALSSALMFEQKHSDCSVRVVSIPFISSLVENKKLLNELVPVGLPTFGIEAGVSMNLAQVCGRTGFVFGLDHFGHSAPYAVLAREFGFNAEAFCQYVERKNDNNQY